MSISSTALTKRSHPSDSALMPPPPPPKRIKRPAKVLDEDTYTSALSHIIARDFFPGLLETESTRDYLNALDTGDEEWIEEAEKRVREVLSTPQRSRRGVSMTPRHVAAGDATPLRRTDGTPTPLRAGSVTPLRSGAAGTSTANPKEEVNINLSLSDFQAKYTSEDNESFNKVLDRQNEKRRAKYGWLWNGNKIPSARQIAQAAHNQKLITQGQSQRHDRFGGVKDNTETALVLRPSDDQKERPAGIQQIRPYNPRNTFMYAPEGDITETNSSLISDAQNAQDASRAGPKAVSYASTRLPLTSLPLTGDQGEDLVPVSPSLSSIDAAIRGNPRHRAISAAAGFVPGSVLEDPGATPRVHGYAFVDAEPAPHELRPPPAPTADGKKAPRDRNELLQHLLGINAHDGDAKGPNPFNLQDKSKREDLHHRMVDKQLASKRSSRLQTLQSEGKTPVPRFMSSPVVGQKTPGGAKRDRMQGNLTPAADRLYRSVGRTPVRGAFDAGGTGGPAKTNQDWTPKVLAGVTGRGKGQ